MMVRDHFISRSVGDGPFHDLVGSSGEATCQKKLLICYIATFVYNGPGCGRLVVPGGQEWSKMVSRWHGSDFTHHIYIIRHLLSEYWNSKLTKNYHLESFFEKWDTFENFISEDFKNSTLNTKHIFKYSPWISCLVVRTFNQLTKRGDPLAQSKYTRRCKNGWKWL